MATYCANSCVFIIIFGIWRWRKWNSIYNGFVFLNVLSLYSEVCNDVDYVCYCCCCTHRNQFFWIFNASAPPPSRNSVYIRNLLCVLSGLLNCPLKYVHIIAVITTALQSSFAFLKETRFHATIFSMLILQKRVIIERKDRSWLALNKFDQWKLIAMSIFFKTFVCFL